MKHAAILTALGLSLSVAGLAQGAQRRAPQPAAPLQKTAQAYEQFLLAHHLEDADDVTGAIAAYKRAMDLDPSAAEIPAELAALYLREERLPEATATAEQALKVSPTNAEANRVLGVIYATRAENARAAQPPAGAQADDNLAKAIGYLEAAVAHPLGEADPSARATLARLYVRANAFDKAIPLLTDLVGQQPGWLDGPLLLAQAYLGANRVKDGIEWLEDQVADDPRLLPTLADFYERERRWTDAARAYGLAVRVAPRNVELKTRYASALLNTGDRDAIGQARSVLEDVVMSARTPDPRSLYLLSEAERRLGDYAAAEATARRLISAQNGRSVYGYYALAEALELRRQFKTVVDEVGPAVADLRQQPGDHGADLGLLLPHLGFAYQQLGQIDQAIGAFGEAHRVQPDDPAIASYLIEANLLAKRYGAAVDLAKEARLGDPNNLRLAGLLAQALRQDGKLDQGISVLEDAVKTHADEPPAYLALAQLYSDASRGEQAVKVLQDAQTKFPSNNAIVFELGAVFDKQKKFADAEAAFQAVIRNEPDNAPALNYLGYMLAERGERLDESVDLVKRALEIDPENGSYLDSLGWAYFKANKLDLARDNLQRAANQLVTNSVIQDHYGDVLSKLGRNEEAIAAWTRALSGDGDTIDRAGIDKKIRAARQKLGRR